MPGPMWIQTVWHSDGIPEKQILKKNHQTTKRMKNYTLCKELNPNRGLLIRLDCGRLNTCDFVCGTMSHARRCIGQLYTIRLLSSDILGCGSETSIIITFR